MLRRIADGEHTAFTILFRYHAGKVYRFALRLTRNEAHAQETVQEVFLKVWLNRSKLTEVDDFSAWLSRVNRNICLDAVRKMARDNKAGQYLSTHKSELSHETEENISFNEAKSLLDRAVSTLTPQQQKVYKLCHVDGKKYEEAARELNLSPGTIHTHMKQALKAIREYLDHAEVAILICVLTGLLKK